MKQAKSYGNQQTLFPIKEVIELNIIKGREGRDEGMERASLHAEKVNPGWNEKAYEFLLRFLNNHNGTFMCEEIRSYAAQMDFELPPSARSWGSIIFKAVKEGLIVRAGYAPVRNKKAHATPATLWRQVKTSES